MKARRAWLVASLALVTLFASVPSIAQDDDGPEDLASDLIHSDVPLWSFDHEDLWPRSFSNEGPDFEFGCFSRIAFGDWQISTHDPTLDQRFDEWIRLSNYGVFHCALIERRNYERTGLAKARFEYGWIAKIGETKVEGRTIELWVLQIGMRTGSNYTLLARAPAEGVVKESSILQSKCPEGALRSARGMDVWSTEYCAINSKSEMIDLANRMARLAPLATMRWIGKTDESDNDE